MCNLVRLVSGIVSFLVAVPTGFLWRESDGSAGELVCVFSFFEKVGDFRLNVGIRFETSSAIKAVKSNRQSLNVVLIDTKFWLWWSLVVLKVCNNSTTNIRDPIGNFGARVKLFRAIQKETNCFFTFTSTWNFLKGLEYVVESILDVTSWGILLPKKTEEFQWHRGVPTVVVVGENSVWIKRVFGVTHHGSFDVFEGGVSLKQRVMQRTGGTVIEHRVDGQKPEFSRGSVLMTVFSCNI